MASMVFRLYDFLKSCMGIRRKIGEISNAKCSGARKYDTPSWDCSASERSSRSGWRSCRSEADKFCLQQNSASYKKAVKYPYD